jgi:Lysylphosphatidylglycerol synthase TM region
MKMQTAIALANSMRPLAQSRTAKVTVSLAMIAIALGVLASNFELSKMQSDVRALSPSAVVIFSSALLANVLIAAIRFRAISGDMGYPVSVRQAMTAVSAGGLAGALFFQVAGQLIARGAVMGKIGTPFANVVVITAYERAIAAVLSAAAALAGAYFIFGKIYLDPTSGGIDLIKIACGLIATAVLGAALGYGRTAAHSIAPYMTKRFARQLLKVIVLTGLVQIPMMIAYVAIAHSLSLETPLADLVAASLVVMFAASVPISLAGWGVREMSAVAALGTIGVPSHVAFTTAILVGFGSLVAMGVILSVSMMRSASKNTARAAAPQNGSIDYGRALRWAIPLAAATLVLFQIYVPIGAGLLNVNLADPVVILGGALFLLAMIKTRRLPQWRVSYINIAVMVATISP